MPEQTVEVRRVDFNNPRDIADYLDLLDAYARDPMGAGRPLSASVRDRLPGDLAGHPGARCLLARHGTTTVGVATCFLGYSTFRAMPLLNIHDIAVLPHWRGRAVARQLLSTIDGIARNEGCCAVTLEVRADNTRARAVYARAGFAPAPCGLFLEKSV